MTTKPRTSHPYHMHEAILVQPEALVRVVRLLCAVGLHTGSMTVPEATQRFTDDAFLAGPAAVSEARRGLK